MRTTKMTKLQTKNFLRRWLRISCNQDARLWAKKQRLEAQLAAIRYDFSDRAAVRRGRLETRLAAVEVERYEAGCRDAQLWAAYQAISNELWFAAR